VRLLLAGLSSSRRRSGEGQTDAPAGPSCRDVRGYTKGSASMDPLNVYRGHSAIVEDVAWHNLQEDVFASVGDDRMLLLCVPLSPRSRSISFSCT